MNLCGKVFDVTMLFVLLHPSAAGAADDALSAVVARQEAVRVIEVVFDSEETVSPVGNSEKAARRASKEEDWVSANRQVQRSRTGRFRFARDQVWYEWRPTNADPEAGNDFAYKIESYSQGRSEMAWKQLTEGRHRGMIRDKGNLPTDSVMDLALGLRGYRDEEWLREEDWLQMPIARDDEYLVLRRQAVSGALKEKAEEWRFDKSAGYALAEYTVFWRGKVSVQVSNRDFRVVGHVKLPYHVTFVQFFNGESEKHEIGRKEVRVRQYSLSPPPEDFLILWNDGTEVLDARTDTPLAVTGGPRKLDEATLAEYAKGKVRLEQDSLARSGTRLWMLAGNILLACSLALGAIFWRLRRRTLST